MSALGKYFVKGHFVGQFTTNQGKVLSAGDPLPQGDEHQVKIYRGIIEQPIHISVDEFVAAKGFHTFREVNNIQINASSEWPVENDRIFSLNHLKMNNIQVGNITTEEGITRGELRGDIIASVSDLPFTNKDDKPYNPGKAAKPFNVDDSNVGSPGNGTNNPNPTDDPDNPGGGSGGQIGTDKPGCFGLENPMPQLRNGCNSKWLRWLLYLLLILLLLYFLATCTKIGQNLYCKFDNWRIKKELIKTQGEIDTLYERIQQTLPVAQPCGTSIDHDGKTELWEQNYNIGTQDGTVAIIFDAVDIPDRLEVIYDGKLVAQTNSNTIDQRYEELNGKGFQQGTDTLYYTYKYDKKKPTELLLRVIPNRDNANTEWNIKLSCPQ